MPTGKTVRVLVEETLSGLKAAGYSADSLNGFRQKYDGLLVYCADSKIEQYTEEVGDQYMAYIARTRTFRTKEASRAFSREIARLNCALNDLPWEHARRRITSYEKSIFEDIVSGYEQYLTEKKASMIRFSVTIVARFLKQVELSGCTDLNTLDAKTIYDIFTNGTINTEYFGRHIKPFCKYAYVYLSAINGKRNYAIILIAARLGLRAGDIAQLKMENVNFSDSTIRIVQSKTHKPLKLPMSDEIKTALQEYLSTFNLSAQNEYLFQRQFYAGGITGSAVSSIVHTAFLRADVDRKNKKSSAHALRASLATALLNEGNGYDVIRDVLGHSDIQVSKAYVKTEIEKLRSNAIPVPPMSGSFAAQLSKAGVRYE